MSLTNDELKRIRTAAKRGTADRQTASGALETLEALYPAPDLRKAVMRILAEAVQTADSFNDRVWSITHYCRSIRLNVGRALVLELLPGALWIVADPRALDRERRDAVAAYEQERGLYQVLDDATTAYYIEGTDIPRLAQLVAPGHVATLKAASATQSGNTAYKQAWSPGVVKLIEEQLDTRLPRPAWEGEGRPRSGGAGTATWWKVAPGRNAAEWDSCRRGGYILIGWARLGDLTDARDAEFRRRRAELVRADLDGYTAAAMDQVWRFRNIAEGDWIVANNGTGEVVGVGRVTGPYYFVAGDHHPHRLPVDWLDIRPFEVKQRGWVKTLRKLNATTVSKIEEQLAVQRTDSAPAAASVDAAFSPRAFELLDLLRESPRRQTYKDHKAEFQAELIKPFQTVLHDVVSRLPPLMTEGVETRRRLFGQIPKNDYGQGGAWPFYWGALYPESEKRTTGAQLFLWMDASVLRFGMSIGELSAAARERFQRNLDGHRSAMLRHATDLFSDSSLTFGTAEADGGELAPSGDQWLREPDRQGVQVARELAAADVLQMNRADLVGLVVRTFRAVFPLFVLAAEEDPSTTLTTWWDDEEDEDEPLQPPYTFDDLCEDSLLPPTRLRQWLAALNRKGQAVLYGPPGTGKTWVAQRMAAHLVGGTRGFVDLLQLHPAYAYEDFMQGIRPVVAGETMKYSVVPGRFLEFCRRANAKEVGGAPCVLILDELNRANLSRVFGELMYLLEYRDAAIPLSGGGRFSIPGNVRILGTMNTADRSIALVDHALRRRFAFLQLEPVYEVLERYHAENGAFPTAGLVSALKRVNAAIDDPNYSVGISFFLREGLASELEGIWRMEIEPYLAEYFFDRPAALAELRWEVLGTKMLS